MADPQEPLMKNLMDNVGRISHIYLAVDLLKVPENTPLEIIIPQAIEKLTNRKKGSSNDWHTFQALEYVISSLPNNHSQKAEWAIQASELRKAWNVPNKRS